MQTSCQSTHFTLHPDISEYILMKSDIEVLH